MVSLKIVILFTFLIAVCLMLETEASKSSRNKLCTGTDPCLNGGTCITSTLEPGFECICIGGYGGQRCEQMYFKPSRERQMPKFLMGKSSKQREGIMKSVRNLACQLSDHKPYEYECDDKEYFQRKNQQKLCKWLRKRERCRSFIGRYRS